MSPTDIVFRGFLDGCSSRGKMIVPSSTYVFGGRFLEASLELICYQVFFVVGGVP